MVSSVIWHQFKYAWERYRYRVLGQKIAKYIDMKSYQRKRSSKYTRDCGVSCHSQQRAFPTAVTCHTILHIYSSLAGTYKQQHRRNKRATIEYQKVNAFLVSHLRVRFFHSSFFKSLINLPWHQHNKGREVPQFIYPKMPFYRVGKYSQRRAWLFCFCILLISISISISISSYISHICSTVLIFVCYRAQ